MDSRDYLIRLRVLVARFENFCDHSLRPRKQFVCCVPACCRWLESKRTAAVGRRTFACASDKCGWAIRRLRSARRFVQICRPALLPWGLRAQGHPRAPLRQRFRALASCCARMLKWPRMASSSQLQSPDRLAARICTERRLVSSRRVHALGARRSGSARWIGGAESPRSTRAVSNPASSCRLGNDRIGARARGV